MYNHKRVTVVSQTLPTMQTRDVVTSSATILGLILAAFGILVTLAGESEQVIVKNFALVFTIVVVFFVCSVIFTTFSSLLRKSKLWSCALVSYVFGWSVLGTVMVLTLIGYGYGIEMLQLQLPQFNVELVTVASTVVGLVASIVLSVFLFRQVWAYRKQVSELSSRVDVSRQEYTKAFNKLELESLDLGDQLVLLRRDIEREILKLAKLSGIIKRIGRHVSFLRLVDALLHEEVLSPYLARTLHFVYRECSRAVHGEVLSDKDAGLVRELGLKTLVTLTGIVKELSTK